MPKHGYSVDDVTRRSMRLSIASESLGEAYRSVDTAESAAAKLVQVQAKPYDFFKRCLDVPGALCLMILTWPIWFVAALAIKLNDGGPIFFKQTRVGQGGREFQCWKFRSMVMNADELWEAMLCRNEHCDNRTFKLAEDPRVTPVGRFLRRWSIDELPQLINVLLGGMSLVGPRPPLPSEVRMYSSEDLRRLEVRPGLTCVWQVSGRSTISFPEQVRMDVEYVDRRSLWLDMKLLLLTIPAVLSRRGAW